MMQHSSMEVNFCAVDDAQAGGRTTRYFGVCDRMLVGFAILTIVHTSEALAGEQVPPTVNAAKPDFNVAREFTPTRAFVLPLPSSYPAVPSNYQAVDLPEFKSFSAAQFRPRGHSILEKDSRLADAEDAPMLRGTTVWQRLSDYRSRDRVRVVTLWETGGSSVSLQAGKRGDPSLQWTSRLMNRGGATRGLLDQVLATSLGGVAHSLHLTPRAAGADAFGKPSKSAETVLGNGGAGTK
ncbi:MAG TPA: hypothetical protein VN325_46965 [Steroidobacteraceae bacterium]|nr:hypothetical protein [Steroidobacteraceae bacterium]